MTRRDVIKCQQQHVLNVNDNDRKKSNINDSDKNANANVNKLFFGACGAKYSLFFFDAFGAKCQKQSLASSAQNARFVFQFYKF